MPGQMYRKESIQQLWRPAQLLRLHQGSRDQGGKQGVCVVSGGNKIQFVFFFSLLRIRRLAPDGSDLEKAVNDGVCSVVTQQQHRPKRE